jgi:hypothetical protein
MLIAVDAGKFGTKGVIKDKGKIKHNYIRTKYEEGTEGALGSNIITWNNTNYILGDEATNIDYDVSKERLPHKLTTYATIAEFIGKKCSDVQLVIGCPLYTYLNSEAREQYKSFMMGNKSGKIEFKLNGEPVKFQITDITVLPESIGVAYQNPDVNINKLIPTIDIGGLNSNGCIYSKLKPVRESIFTVNEGGDILLAKIQKEINKKLGTNFQEYEMEYVVNGNYTAHDAKQKKQIENIIDSTVTAHLEKIIKEAKRRNWNISGAPVNFTGGTSEQFAEYIKKVLPNAVISKNATWDNAEAFYKIGEMLNG